MNKNFEEFFSESLRTEELPCVVGGIETDNSIQLSDANLIDVNTVQ